MIMNLRRIRQSFLGGMHEPTIKAIILSSININLEVSTTYRHLILGTMILRSTGISTSGANSYKEFKEIRWNFSEFLYMPRMNCHPQLS